jgi:hypothetical protein
MIWVCILLGVFVVLPIMEWLGIANDNILAAALVGGAVGYGIELLAVAVKKMVQPALGAPISASDQKSMPLESSQNDDKAYQAGLALGDFVKGIPVIWAIKCGICAIYDLLDMTVGRMLFATPFAGEVIGAILACSLFGKAGWYYALEAIDPTEQIDGFVPTATIIAMRNKPKRVSAS